MKVTPLSQGFGAEISGFDVRDGRDAADVAALKRAYAEHHLLLFRAGTPLTPERQVEITGWFGIIGANRNTDGQPWSTLHNDQKVGSEILPFHCDISYMEHPIEGISLHPLELPDVPTSTSFASNALGWDALPEDVREQLRPLKVRHYFAEGAQLSMDWPTFEYWHPILTSHRTTGRPMLFATEHHSDRIEGMSDDHSAAMLREIFAALYAPERCYEHVWSVGDLLIWDNRAVQHARTRRSPPSDGARVMQRVALGEHNFMDQLEKLKAA